MGDNERPLYVLAQVKNRRIIPNSITLIFLGLIFYGGVILNLALLELGPDLARSIRLLTAGFIIIIVLLGIIITIAKAKKKYRFYRDRIIFGKKQILYSEITAMEIKTIRGKLWDSIFKTYSLSLKKNFIIKHISITINLTNYVQQLITYSSNRVK